MKKLITIFFCFFIISNLFASELDKVQELIEIKKYDEALDLLRDLSEDGNIDAHKVLASIYVNGGYVKQNIRLAILYLNRAVDAGDSRAALTLLNVINDHGHNLKLDDFDRITKISSKKFQNETKKIIEKIKTKNIILFPDINKSPEKPIKNNEQTETIEVKNRIGWILFDTDWGVLNNIEQYWSKAKSGGTGFFINDNGYIVTNYHVVEDCKKIVIHPNITAESSLAQIINQNIPHDLALLKVNNKSPMFLSISEKKPLLGAKITVGGYPSSLSLGHSIKITQGILSGSLIDGKKENDFLDIIDAAVQQGSSGSPVINENGNLIGVVHAVQRDLANQVEQTLNYIINWESLKKFLKNSNIKYNVDRYDKSLSSVTLAGQLQKTAVTILCIGK